MKKAAVWIGLILTIIGLVVWYKNRKPKVIAPVFPLKLGSGGAEVIELQKHLNTKGAKIKEDGFYGAETAKAVESLMNRKSISKEFFDKAITPNARKS